MEKTNIPIFRNNTMQAMVTHFVNRILGIDNPNNSSLNNSIIQRINVYTSVFLLP
jgi:hypothetical protein